MRALVAVLAVAGALAGCGEDEPAATSSPTPAPTASATERATPTPEPTEIPTATEQPGPEEQEGGVGDEEEARVPVRFTVRDDGIEPPEVGVPGFLALELIIRNDTSRPIVARLEATEPLTVNPGETTRARIEGRRPGRYPIDFGDAGEAVLVTGVEPGP